MKPHLLIVAATNRRRGAEIFAERLREGLSGRGWEVDAVSLTAVPGGGEAELDPVSDVAPDRIGRFSLEVARSLRRHIRRLDPDLVLANGGSTIRYCVPAAWGHRSRLAYAAIGESRYWVKSGWARFLMRWLLRRSDAVLAVSQASLDQIVDLEPSLRAKGHVARTGVPPELFAKRSGPSRGPLHVVMVGSLTPEKDPVAALRAVSGVPDAVIRFVGGGPLRADLETEAIRLGIVERVELAGVVDDVLPHLEWADAILLTSRTEGLPGALLEGGAAGAVAVAYGVGGVAEIVVDGETGFVVAPGDVSGLTAALSRLDEDRAMCAALGAAARARIESEFPLAASIDRYEKLLSNLLGDTA